MSWKIIQGIVVSVSAFPFVAMLIGNIGNDSITTTTITSRSSHQFMCTAFHVGNSHFMTAAHCMQEKATYHLILGADSLNSSDSIYVPVEDCGVHIHPLHNPETMQYDVAILTLPPSLDFGGLGPDERYLHLPMNTSEVEEFERVDTKLSILGYGVDETGRINWLDKTARINDHYGVLREGMVHVVDPTHFTNENIDHETMMMAEGDPVFFSNQVVDSCYGDSGGPLFDKNTSTVVGIVSWGISCGLANYPGVYARISSALPWIQQILKK
jgi:trypsin